MVHPVGVLVRRGEAEFGILEETTDGVLANIFGGNDLGVLGPEIEIKTFSPPKLLFHRTARVLSSCGGGGRGGTVCQRQITFLTHVKLWENSSQIELPFAHHPPNLIFQPPNVKFQSFVSTPLVFKHSLLLLNFLAVFWTARTRVAGCSRSGRSPCRSAQTRASVWLPETFF